jgi:hypothetical protein
MVTTEVLQETVLVCRKVSLDDVVARTYILWGFREPSHTVVPTRGMRGGVEGVPEWARALVPGVLMGLVRVGVSYPVDYVRTRVQAGNLPWRAALAGVTRPWHLYRGASLSFAGVGAERGVQLAVFEWAQQPEGLHWGPGAAGAAASTVTCALSTGIQAVLTRHIVHGTALGTASKVVTGVGLRATAATMGPELARSWAAGTIFLGLYGSLLPYVPHPALAAVAANWACLAVTYPLETLRIRAHAEGVGPRAAAAALWAAGPRAAYRGLSLALARAVPATAAGFTVYDWAKRQMHPGQ